MIRFDVRSVVRRILVIFAIAAHVTATKAAVLENESDSTAAIVDGLGVDFGYVGLLDEFDDDAIAGVEYRWALNTDWPLSVAVGAAGTDTGAFFVYGDVHYDYALGDHWLLSPSFGVGRFTGNESIDLGHLVEFRTGVEIAYRLDNEMRVGLVLLHFSNGGISEHNPGVEILSLSLAVPFPRS